MHHWADMGLDIYILSLITDFINVKKVNLVLYIDFVLLISINNYIR